MVVEKLAQQILNCRISNMTEGRRQMLYRDPHSTAQLDEACQPIVWDYSVILSYLFPTLKKVGVGWILL